MRRLLLLGLGALGGACLSLEELAEDADGGSGSGGAADAGAETASGGSWGGDGSSGAPSDAPADVVLDTWDGNPCSPDSPPLLDDFGQNGKLGSAWTGDVGAYQMSNGELRHVQTNADDRILYSKVLCPTQTASVRVMSFDPQTELAGVLFAKTTNHNCDLVEVGYSPKKQAVEIWQCAGGWKALMSKAWPVLPGDRIEARLANGQLTALVNNQPVGSVSVGTWPGSRPGIFVYLGSTAVSFDDFRGG